MYLQASDPHRSWTVGASSIQTEESHPSRKIVVIVVAALCAASLITLGYAGTEVLPRARTATDLGLPMDFEAGAVSDVVELRDHAELIRFPAIDDRGRIPEPMRRVLKGVGQLPPILRPSDQDRIDSVQAIDPESVRQIQRQFGRAVKSTMEGYLIEMIGLSGRLAQVRAHGGINLASASNSEPRSSPYSLQLGVSHLRPTLALRTRLGSGSLAYSLAIPGTLDIGYSSGDARLRDVSLAFDHGRKTITMRLRFAF